EIVLVGAVLETDALDEAGCLSHRLTPSAEPEPFRLPRPSVVNALVRTRAGPPLRTGRAFVTDRTRVPATPVWGEVARTARAAAPPLRSVRRGRPAVPDRSGAPGSGPG